MFARLRLALMAATFALPALAQTAQSVPQPLSPPPVTNPIPSQVKPATPPPRTPVVPPSAATKPAVPAPGTAAAPAAASIGKVDINSASLEQLDTLYGVGQPRAKKIIAGRPYTSLDDLVKKKVLTKAVFDGARARMALANINTSSAKDLEKTLPGIGDVRSKAIVAGRPYAAPADLVSKGVLTQGQFDAIAGLISN